MVHKLTGVLRKLGNGFHKVAKALDSALGEKVNLNNKSRPIDKWFADEGDKTLRLFYDSLTPDSIVFDIGGFEGQWASDIYSKYLSKIFIFEPYMPFYSNIKNRFIKNDSINVFPFGLGSKDVVTSIFPAHDGTSIYKQSSERSEIIEVKDIVAFIKSEEISTIDLMKINIEGGEYELLERLIESGFIGRVTNIQVQFHDDYVENAGDKMNQIHNKLCETHELSWQYVFVWENWVLKNN